MSVVSEPKNRVAELVDTACLRLGELDVSGALRRHVSDDWLRSVGEAFAEAHPLAPLPPLLLLLGKNDIGALRQFDDDVLAAGRASTQPGRVEGFIQAGRRTDHDSNRQWFAGCAELALCAAAVDRYGEAHVVVDPVLPSGGRCDLRVELSDGTSLWIEVTALSTSNDVYESFDHEADVQVMTGDPYHDARRVYRKAFDKIAGTDDRLQSQLHPTQPTALVLVDGSAISPNLDSLGADWAIEQMMNPASRGDTSRASLVGFIAHDFPGRESEALGKLRHVGAIILLNYDQSMIQLHENADVDEAHRLGAEHLAELKGLLSSRRSWR